MDVARRQFRLRPDRIVLMQYILEGYEGIFSVTTLDPVAATVEVSVMPDFLADADQILTALQKEISFAEVPPSPLTRPRPC